jgi:hypothetical protein
MAILIDMDISVRGVPADLWRRFRVAALERGLTIREALTGAIELWLAQPSPQMKDAEKPKL